MCRASAPKPYAAGRCTRGIVSKNCSLDSYSVCNKHVKWSELNEVRIATVLLTFHTVSPVYTIRQGNSGVQTIVTTGSNILAQPSRSQYHEFRVGLKICELCAIQKLLYTYAAKVSDRLGKIGDHTQPLICRAKPYYSLASVRVLASLYTKPNCPWNSWRALR